MRTKVTYSISGSNPATDWPVGINIDDLTTKREVRALLKAVKRHFPGLRPVVHKITTEDVTQDFEEK